jgi:hypothetical protein
MDDTPHPLGSPPGWAEALDESLAELAAGVPTIPGEVVRRELLDSIARMKAKRADAASAKRPRGVGPRGVGPRGVD